MVLKTLKKENLTENLGNDISFNDASSYLEKQDELSNTLNNLTKQEALSLEKEDKNSNLKNLMSYIGEGLKSKGFANALQGFGTSLAKGARENQGQMVNGIYVPGAIMTDAAQEINNLNEKDKKEALIKEEKEKQEALRIEDLARAQEKENYNRKMQEEAIERQKEAQTYNRKMQEKQLANAGKVDPYEQILKEEKVAKVVEERKAREEEQQIKAKQEEQEQADKLAIYNNLTEVMNLVNSSRDKFGDDWGAVLSRGGGQLAGTKEWQNVVDAQSRLKNVIFPQLKALFGGNPTEGERLAALEMGIDLKASPDVVLENLNYFARKLADKELELEGIEEQAQEQAVINRRWNKVG